jgi:hypothetical protein
LGLKTFTSQPASVNAKYGWVSSAHQNPTGQPVVVDTAGFEITIAARLGRLGLTGLMFLWLKEAPRFA